MFRLPCRKVELHHLPTGQVLTWEHDDAGLRRHIERAHQIAADALRAEEEAAARRERDGDDADIDDLFPARRGVLCGYCDVVRSCAAGLEETNAVLRAPWAVLDGWSETESREGA